MTPCFAVWHTARTKEYRSRVLFEKGRMMAPEIIVAIVGASTTLIAAVARAVVSVRASRSKKKKRATGLASIETQMRARGSSGVRSDAAACIAADACVCVIEAVRHARQGVLVEDEATARLRVRWRRTRLRRQCRRRRMAAAAAVWSAALTLAAVPRGVPRAAACLVVAAAVPSRRPAAAAALGLPPLSPAHAPRVGGLSRRCPVRHMYPVRWAVCRWQARLFSRMLPR